MDEPRRSAARDSRYLIPIGLVVLLGAYVGPHMETQQGPYTVTYSRLLGLQLGGETLEIRQVVGASILELTWVAVAVTALRRATPLRRAFVYGAAALLGFSELLFLAARFVLEQAPGGATYLGGVGGVLLIAGAIVGLDRAERPEIRGPEEGRA